MMIREETRALLGQWRARMGACPAAHLPIAPTVAVVAPSQGNQANRRFATSASKQQQRSVLSTATTATSTNKIPPGLLFGAGGAVAPTVARPALEQNETMVVKHQLVACEPINSGKQLVLKFADGTKYQVHTSWLKDSSPKNRAADFYRTSAADVWKLRNFSIVSATVAEEGQKLQVTFETGSDSATDFFEAQWLHAFAPFVGKPLHADVVGEVVRGTGSLLRNLHRNRTAWMSDIEMPVFDAATLAASEDAQVDFLENMVDPGIALVTGVGTPEHLEREFAGKPMEDLVFKIIGKLNQHPVRSTTYGVMRKTADSAKQGADYDMSNPLSMHTDHSVYQGTPGYLQFLYQAEGSVRSKVCDGLALAEYVREHHPEAFRLLTTVQMTHSSRNTLYSREGAPRSVYDKTSAPAPFELVHTHPIIQLDEEGLVEKVVQSETKRGVCALSYDVYNEFMEAYEVWTQLCEDPRFIKHFDWPEGTMVVTNNYRTLHGRASVPPGMARTMCFGYVNKILVENRYRLLKQGQAERRNPDMDHRWLTRIPNQVLEKLTTDTN
eukprot:CAMPEP_0115209760 /NCGR_PEP_ID=MMETSP0270-20121206/21900_1 /TAXON_ID=71861 /ORGANISM="Scrippsiella trochoidea, Strain CCMP3099" /LENGTH=552 /DNA_ID=CAMNT_0002623399 /DNA_START=89 /DNA_END=1747 /DNA_ORIENTATION=-